MLVSGAPCVDDDESWKFNVTLKWNASRIIYYTAVEHVTFMALFSLSAKPMLKLTLKDVNFIPSLISPSLASYFPTTNHYMAIGTSGYRMEIRKIQAVDKASKLFKWNLFNRFLPQASSIPFCFSLVLAASLKREQLRHLRSISFPHPSRWCISCNGYEGNFSGSQRP